MLEDGPGLDDLRWASSEDRIKVEVDQSIYGECWVREDDAGLYHRIDPLTIGEVEPSAPVINESERSEAPLNGRLTDV